VPFIGMGAAGISLNENECIFRKALLFILEKTK
jgi:hypothetical protein